MPAQSKSNLRSHILLWIVSAILLILFLENKLFFPLHLDESVNFSSILDWKISTPLMPLFSFLIIGYTKLTTNVANIRIYVLIFSILNFAFLLGIAKELRPSLKTHHFVSILAVLLLFPVTRLATIFFDENIFLNTALSFFLYLFLHFRRHPLNSWRFFLLFVAYSATLWIKLTTPLVLPLFIMILLFWDKIKKYNELAYSWSSVIIFFLFSWSVFLVSYFLFNAQFEAMTFVDRFAYIFVRSSGFRFDFLIYQILYLILWISPYFIFLMAAIGYQIFRKKEYSIDQLILILIGLLFIVYFKTHFFAGSFPKYLIWFFQLAIITSYIYLSESKVNFYRKEIWAIFVCVLFFYLTLNDPLLFRFPITTGSFIQPGFMAEFAHEGLKRILISLVPTVCFLLIYRKITLKMLLILASAYCLNITILQSIAPYSTVYAYGERNFKELMAFTKKTIPSDAKVYGIKDMDAQFFPYHHYTTWYFEFEKNSSLYKEYVLSIKPKYIVFRQYWLSPQFYKNYVRFLNENYYLEIYNGDLFHVFEKIGKG